MSEILQIKKGNFLKVGKFACILFVIMLIVATFSVFNVKTTTVENTNVSAGYVKASQTYVLVLNFTINTTSDTLLAGLGPSDGQILENDNQSTDWGGIGKMLYYDNSSGSEGGGWDASIDCIFLDDVTSDEQYNDTETVLAGSAPPIGTNASGYGCKNMSSWHRVKSYDAADAGVWNAAADAIIFEGEDNNTCYHEELNAVTFKLNSTCNGTSSDISDLTFWVENTGDGFSSSDDTLLGNASFSADSFSWNISSLTQDINVTATFYAAVNLSATAVHWNTIRMDIPTKIDNATTGSYTNDDQGLFLAGTNDTGNIVNTNNLTIDTFAPETSVDAISGEYWKNSSRNPLAMAATTEDNCSGLANASLWYNYSVDNSTWGDGFCFDTDSTPGSVSWSFTFSNGSGYYRFYSRGADNVSNNETWSVTDTQCGYDLTTPTATVGVPTNNGNYNALAQVNGSCNDTFSDISSVNITIFNVTGVAYWNGSTALWDAAVSWISTTVADDCDTWSNSTSSISWTNNSQYRVNATATDNGSTVGVTDSNSFTYDSSTPTATVSVPVNGNYYNSLISVSGSCNDSVSDISSVNITVFNVTGDAFYNDSSSAWQSSVSWISTTLGGDYDSWSYDTSGVTWTDNSLYFVNATATDNASNTGSNDSNSFTFDSSTPTISSLSPASGSSTANTLSIISAVLSDLRSGVDSSSVIIKVDNVNQTSNATVTSTSISYTPSSALSYASHTVNLTVSDTAGNTGYSEWSFTVYEGGGSGGGTTPATTPLILNVDHNPDEPTKNDTVTINATVIARGTNSIASVTLYWNDGTDHSKAMTLEDETNGLYSAQIGPFQELTTVTYYIVATDDAGQDTTATDDDYTFTAADATGPTITIDMPADGSTIYDTMPTIKANYSDMSGIDTDSVTLTIDEVTVTPTITSTLVTYTPTTNMTFGEHNVEVNVSDTLGNSATKNWSFTILQSETISEEEVGNVTSGEETEVEPENSDETGIEGIMFTATADLTNVKITVVKLSGKPEYIAEDPTKVVAIYAYLEIGITADDKYISDDDIESIKISFKVEQTWMEENNIDNETIVLMKYHNNEWQKLSTTVISEDAVYVYFESETTGFSTFAIAVDEGEEPTEEPETPGLPLLIIIGAIIAAIIIIIIILYKKGYINISRKHP